MKRNLFAFVVILVTISACGSPAPSTVEPTLSPTFTITPTNIPFPTITSSPIGTPTSTTKLTQNGSNSVFVATLPIASVNNATQQEIARLLFTQWLDHFKTEGELDDYELLNVSLLSLVRDGLDFVATVDYSVKPSLNAHRAWDAGNGTISPNDPWIRNKSWFIGARKVNDVYILVLIGTGL